MKKLLNGIVQKIFACYKWVRIKHRSELTRRETLFEPDGTELTAEQKKEIRDFYAPYKKKLPRFIRKDIEYYYAVYAKRTGSFDIRYLPDNLHYCIVDPWFNDWDAAEHFENKCLYSRLFSDVPQPETAAMRCNGFWRVNGQTVTEAEALARLAESPELVVKIAQDSCGGHGVYFCKGSDSEKLHALFAKIKEDIIIQKPFVQHPDLARINASSVNTIRIMSMLRGNEVEMVSSILRMGIDGSRVDNASSGGLVCGIEDDGRLKERAYARKDECYTSHPTSGLVFSELKVPAFRECCELVKRLHPTIPWFRLVSWDITVDEQGQPTLIEANMCYGSVDIQQLANGPLLGDETTTFLDEILGIKRS